MFKEYSYVTLKKLFLYIYNKKNHYLYTYQNDVYFILLLYQAETISLTFTTLFHPLTVYQVS